MLRMRLAVPADRADAVLRALEAEPGVTGVVRHPGVVAGAGEDEVTAWIRERSVDEVLAELRALGVVRRGNLTLARQHVIVDSMS